MNRGIVKRVRIAAACVGAVAVGVVLGLLFATTGGPVEGKVVDKYYENEASTAVLSVLVADSNEYEEVRAPAHELVGCYVSRSKPVFYPGCAG